MGGRADGVRVGVKAEEDTLARGGWLTVRSQHHSEREDAEDEAQQSRF